MPDYSPQEVADRLGVVHSTVWRWIKQGKMQARQAEDRMAYRITEEEVERYEKLMSGAKDVRK